MSNSRQQRCWGQKRVTPGDHDDQVAALLDEVREAILADVRAGERSARAIAEAHGVHVSTVSRVAKAAGIEDAFDRAQTRKATEAKTADTDARQAELRARAVEAAHGLLDRLHHRVTVPHAAMGTVTIPARPEDWRNTMTAVGIATDKALAIQKHAQEENGTQHASGLLQEFTNSLRAQHEARERGEA